MKKPEITPGPWTAEDAMKNQDCGWRIHTPESKPYGMAHIYSPGPHAKANATAIAALPDLLESMEPLQGINDSRLRSMNADELRELIWETRSLQMLSLAKAGYTFD